jgi:hypothetical protein
VFELFSSQVLEEWRIHATLFGGLPFLLFPVIAGILAFLLSLFFSIFALVIPAGRFALVIHAFIFLLGLSVGAFGLFGREILNRRFGQASLVAYSSRILPVSERRIFLNFFLKDALYYILLWIAPGVSGFWLATKILPIGNPAYIPLLVAASLTFLAGLSTAFFLSTVFVAAPIIFFLVLAAGGFAEFIFRLPAEVFLPSLYWSMTGSASSLVLSIVCPAILVAISIYLLRTDYAERKERLYPEELSGFERAISFLPEAHLTGKDFLDLWRSGGGIGRAIFAFFIPLLLVWAMLGRFLPIVPGMNLVLTFSLFVGVVSSSIYGWLTEFDPYSSYAFLPVRVSSIIKAKLRGFLLLNIISIPAVLLPIFLTGQVSQLPLALLVFASLSFYSLAVTVFLSGTHPSLFLYNGLNFLGFAALISIPVLLLLLASLLSPTLLALSVLLVIPGALFLRRAFPKWDRFEETLF